MNRDADAANAASVSFGWPSTIGQIPDAENQQALAVTVLTGRALWEDRPGAGFGLPANREDRERRGATLHDAVRDRLRPDGRAHHKGQRGALQELSGL